MADLKSQVAEPHFETSKAWEHSMVQEVQLVQFRALSLQGWLRLLVVTERCFSTQPSCGGF